MANINKIRVSGTTYDIQDTNAALASDVFITAQNRNSIQSRINEGIYSLSTDDIYTITGTKSNPTDKIEGTLIIGNTSYYFSGNTSDTVYTVPDIQGKALFSLGTEFSITTSDRDALHISEIFLESFNASGEKVQMNDIVITHNPAIGVNKIDYVSSLYTEFLHEKYALSSELNSKQDTLVSGTNIKTVNNQSLLGSGNITIQGGGSSVIEVTQAQYDALSQAGTLDLTALYIITDASGGDLANYYTKTETNTLLNAKQATLVSGTNIKTINNESILGSGNIDIQGGGSITVDTELSTTSENPVQNKVVTAALNGKGDRLQWDATSTARKNIPLRLKRGSTILSEQALNLGDYLQYGSPTSSALCITGLTPTTDFTAHTADTTAHVTAAEKSTWNAKSNFSGDYDDLTNKPTIPTVPTSNTAFTNDAGYITSSALNGYATTGDVQTATNDMATKTWVGQQGYLTQHQDISGKQDVSGMTAYTETTAFTAHTADTTIHVTSANKTSWDGAATNASNAVTALGGMSIVKLTQTQYDNLSTYDSNTLYVIVN